MANKEIRKILSKEERIKSKIAELQSQLADLEVLRGQEEDAEMIKALRSMKLSPYELADLLEGIQSGEVTLIKSDEFLAEEGGSMYVAEENISGAQREDAPEKEEDYGGQTNE